MITQKLPATINPNRSARIKSQLAFKEASEVLKETMVAAIMGEKHKVVDKAILHLHRSQKYHFNKITLGVAGFLQAYYSNDIYDLKKGNKYLQIRKKYHQLSYVEELVDSKYWELSSKLYLTRTPSKRLVAELRETCIEFTKYLELESSPINIRIYVLLINLSYIDHNYGKTEQLCKEIIQWLESRKFAFFSGFYNYLVPALIVQGKYLEGKIAIRQALSNVNKKSNNWSVFTYFHFILEIHNKNYQEAFSIFKKANHRGQINLFMEEQWLIVKGYLKFLQRIDLIEGDNKFKLDKLTKNLPIASNDKEGNNINIIILSILLNLKRNRGQIIDQIEAISKYLQRHLKGNIRARLFIKMLLTLPKYNFNPQVIQFRNEALWKQLQKNNIQVVGMSEVEIIPFEDLWPMVLKALE